MTEKRKEKGKEEGEERERSHHSTQRRYYCIAGTVDALVRWLAAAGSDQTGEATKANTGQDASAPSPTASGHEVWGEISNATRDRCAKVGWRREMPERVMLTSWTYVIEDLPRRKAPKREIWGDTGTTTHTRAACLFEDFVGNTNSRIAAPPNQLARLNSNWLDRAQVAQAGHFRMSGFYSKIYSKKNRIDSVIIIIIQTYKRTRSRGS